MRITVIKCNICKKELSGSTITSRIPIVPGVHLIYDTGDPDEDNSGDVCAECQECIAQAVMDTVTDIRRE